MCFNAHIHPHPECWTSQGGQLRPSPHSGKYVEELGLVPAMLCLGIACSSCCLMGCQQFHRLYFLKLQSTLRHNRWPERFQRVANAVVVKPPAQLQGSVTESVIAMCKALEHIHAILLRSLFGSNRSGHIVKGSVVLHTRWGGKLIRVAAALTLRLALAKRC